MNRLPTSGMISSTFVNKGLRTHGTWCYTANADGFVSLYTLNAFREDDPAVAEAEDYFILNAGHRQHAVKLPIPTSGGLVLKNFPVYSGEEVWLNASRPNSHYVYGFSTQTPLA